MTPELQKALADLRHLTEVSIETTGKLLRLESSLRILIRGLEEKQIDPRGVCERCKTFEDALEWIAHPHAGVLYQVADMKAYASRTLHAYKTKMRPEGT